MALAQMPVPVLWFHVPLWVCDRGNSHSLLFRLDSICGWRQGSSWGLPAACCRQALGQIPGPGCGGDCLHTRVRRACANASSPSPQPLDGCQDSALQRWPLRVLSFVPAAVPVHVCREPDSGSKAHAHPTPCLVGGDPAPPTVAAAFEKTSQQGTWMGSLQNPWRL